MKGKLLPISFLGLAALLAAPQCVEQIRLLNQVISSHAMVTVDITESVCAQERGRIDDEDLPVRDEVRQSCQLSPGALVKVSGINGTISVETIDGSTAEVYIVRSARRKEDLAYHKIIIEPSATSLVVRGEKDQDHWRGGDVRQRVELRVPRQIEFAASGINGRTTVGEIDGGVKLSGINGKVEVAQALGYSEVSGINGSVVMTIARLGERGLRISGVNGGVEMRFADELNADLRVSGVNGSIYADVPNVIVQGKISRTDFNAKIGNGGAPINVSGVNGRVRFAPRAGNEK